MSQKSPADSRMLQNIIFEIAGLANPVIFVDKLKRFRL